MVIKVLNVYVEDYKPIKGTVLNKPYNYEIYVMFEMSPPKIHLYCGPNGPTASIFYGIWIIQSGPMVFIFNLDKVSLKKLFPTMNI